MSLKEHLWTGGTLSIFFISFLASPMYSAFLALPYLVALSFRRGEMRSLAYSALIGLLLDVASEAFPLGFFALTLPALTAFLFSLEHFFKKGRALALGLSVTLTVLLTVIEWIWVMLFPTMHWSFFLSLPQCLAIATSLVILNGLITWALLHGQERVERVYSDS